MSFSKFIYNLKGSTYFITPRFLLKNAESKSKEFLEKLNNIELEELKQRLNFYYKSNERFKVKDINIIDSVHRARNKICNPYKQYLKQNTPRHNIYSSVYAYDFREFERFFNKNFMCFFDFGDTNCFFTFPTIVKSRPILNDDLSATLEQDCTNLPAYSYKENSIIFKLDKFRHFSFVKDSMKFEDKKGILFFRGAAYQKNRLDFLKKHFNNPLCNAGHVGNKNAAKEFLAKKASIKEHLEYKFILSLEGNDVASNLKWIMGSNSLAFSPKLKYETWFMESKLKAGEHYCEIKDDYSDVDEKIEYYLTHEKQAKEIIENANNYCKTFKNNNLENAISMMILRKYFYLSNQDTISDFEKDLIF